MGRGEGLRNARAATVLSVVINAALFILKLLAGLASGSVAAMGAAFSSLSHVIYDFGLLHTLYHSHKRADKGHSFMQGRASPIVGVLIAVMIALLGFELLGQAILQSNFSPNILSTPPIIILLIVAVIAELLLSEYYHTHGKRNGNQGLMLAAADARNDVLLTLLTMTAIIFNSMPRLDAFLGMIFAVYLFYYAFNIARAKVNYISGQDVDARVERKIRHLVSSTRGVKGIRSLSFHHFGHYLHVNLHVGVSSRISQKASDRIAMTLQHDIEHFPNVSKVFVTLDPV